MTTVAANTPVTLKPIDLNPIELFAAQYCGHYFKCDVPPFHREIYSALWNVVQGKIKRLLVEAPRDFAKSTLISKIFPLYLICESDKTEMIALSRGGKVDLAKKWLDNIKRELAQNLLLKYDYNIRSNGTWEAHHIQYKRNDGHEGQFIGASKGSSIRGWRPQIVFIDDPQNKDDVDSEAVLERDTNWFYEDLINCLEPDDALVFIGTRLSPISLLSGVAELPDWKVLTYRAYGADGHSIWPEKWSDEALEERRREITDRRFQSEYMNEPYTSENPVFMRDWFQYYEPDSADFRSELARGLYTVTAIDPAISLKDSADYTGIVTISVTYDEKPKIYVRNARRERWTMKQTAEQALLVFNDYKQHKTLVEDVAYQKALMEEIKERERIYRTNVNLYPVYPDRDKLRRAHVVQTLFQEGQVFFDGYDKGQQRLIQELIMFDGRGVFKDDLADALIYALTEAKGWEHNITPVKEAQIVLAHKPRNMRTGIC